MYINIYMYIYIYTYIYIYIYFYIYMYKFRFERRHVLRVSLKWSSLVAAMLVCINPFAYRKSRTFVTERSVGRDEPHHLLYDLLWIAGRQRCIYSSSSLLWLSARVWRYEEFVTYVSMPLLTNLVHLGLVMSYLIHIYVYCKHLIDMWRRFAHIKCRAL